MADPIRDLEPAPADSPARDSRIEELLLAGLDHYFSGQHELAISVWTRVLFLDRSHARARAYIERARSAIAERQREGEELLQTGVAAFQRGDAGDARRLLASAVECGAGTDEAQALLARLDRLAPVAGSAPPIETRKRPAPSGVAAAGARRPLPAAAVAGILACGLGAGAFAMWLGVSGLAPWAGEQPAVSAAPRVEEPLPVPSTGDVSLTRARAAIAKGQLHEALSSLQGIHPGDPQQPQADELRADIQRRLLATVRGTK